MIFRCLIILLLAAGVTRAESLDSVPLYRLAQAEGGEAVAFQLQDETTHVAFYYSASWCPPCKTTTPPLVEEYHRMMNQAGGMVVEIVLVGSDQTEEKMFRYMRKYKMPWPAVVYSANGQVEKYAARGIPHLVLVERKTGDVVSHGTGPSGIEAVVTRMRDFSKVDNDKSFRAGSFIGKYGVLIAVVVSFIAIFLFQKWREKRELQNL